MTNKWSLITHVWKVLNWLVSNRIYYIIFLIFQKITIKQAFHILHITFCTIIIHILWTLNRIKSYILSHIHFQFFCHYLSKLPLYVFYYTSGSLFLTHFRKNNKQIRRNSMFFSLCLYCRRFENQNVNNQWHDHDRHDFVDWIDCFDCYKFFVTFFFVSYLLHELSQRDVFNWCKNITFDFRIQIFSNST